MTPTEQRGEQARVYELTDAERETIVSWANVVQNEWGLDDEDVALLEKFQEPAPPTPTEKVPYA